jgi:hypothetical protein
MRKALDLSITAAPAAAAIGAYSLAWAAPAEKNAISMPLNEAGPSFSTGRDSPLKETDFPTERSDA